jgi:hypothetical protein
MGLADMKECPSENDAPTAEQDVQDRRIALDEANAAQGLGQLALAVVNLLHELLERQAIRRMEAGNITDAQAEKVGLCLMRQSEAIDELCAAFGLERDDLEIDLGPLGKMV